MGLLGDIRSGKKADGGGGGYAIVAWLLIGGACSAAAVSEREMTWFGTIGALMGLVIGLYAAFGASRLAKVLLLPGVLLASVMCLGI